MREPDAEWLNEASTWADRSVQLNPDRESGWVITVDRLEKNEDGDLEVVSD